MIEGPLPENVALFTGVTPIDEDPNIILGAAQRANLESVFIVGWDKDGDLFMSGSMANGPELLWLLKLVEKRLLEIGANDS